MNDPNPSASGRSRLKWHPALWLTGLGVLCIPAIAMLITSEVQWGFGDFAIFGAMLAALLGVVELAMSRQFKLPYKALAIGAALIVFIIVWVELAVGIFD